ncbi:MAG: hypothetical protein ABL967_05940 [Bryobacteraceae bacterium]
MRTLLIFLTAALAWGQQVAEIRTRFEIRYVGEGSVYLNGGRDQGLQEGMRLTVRRVSPGGALLGGDSIADLTITGVTANSAVCSVDHASAELQTGDTAMISSTDLEALQMLQQSKTARRHAQVVSFTEGDPIDQELRDYVPKPPSPAVNQFRGRISYEFASLRSENSPVLLQNGASVRFDGTRLGGSYWNLTGYWRGRINSRASSGQQVNTIRDLMNRTYHIGVFYNNPQSKNMMGFGRMFVPWASSLSTIDGGYYGRRLARHLTVGAFGGSTPDPTAWDYKPNRQLGGAFVSFDLGSFETLRFTNTAGIAVSRVSWKAEREYAFSETTFSLNNRVSIYHNLQADRLTAGRLGNTESGAALSRSFVTLRVQPVSWLTFDFNHNYFRTIPTFDLLLLGTGVLDKFLFDGLSGGLRVELPNHISVYGSVGNSTRTGDTRGSLNQMYGVSVRNFLNLGIRGDARYTTFHGSFGSGWYQAFSATKEFGPRLRMDLTAGEQQFHSDLSTSVRGFFVNGNVEFLISPHYWLGGGINLFRGTQQHYDQTFFTLGYRF